MSHIRRLVYTEATRSPGNLLAHLRYFVNVLSIGITTKVLRFLREHPRLSCLGRFKYLLLSLFFAVAFLLGLNSANVDVMLDKEQASQFKGVFILAVGKARFFGGGVEICPDADASQRRLAVSIYHNLTIHKMALEVLKGVARLTRPAFSKRVLVSTAYIAAARSDELVEADGEIIGRLPASASIAPRYLTLLVN